MSGFGLAVPDSACREISLLGAGCEARKCGLPIFGNSREIRVGLEREVQQMEETIWY